MVTSRFAYFGFLNLFTASILRRFGYCGETKTGAGKIESFHRDCRKLATPNPLADIYFLLSQMPMQNAKMSKSPKLLAWFPLHTCIEILFTDSSADLLRLGKRNRPAQGRAAQKGESTNLGGDENLLGVTLLLFTFTVVDIRSS